MQTAFHIECAYLNFSQYMQKLLKSQNKKKSFILLVTQAPNDDVIFFFYNEKFTLNT